MHYAVPPIPQTHVRQAVTRYILTKAVILVATAIYSEGLSLAFILDPYMTLQYIAENCAGLQIFYERVCASQSRENEKDMQLVLLGRASVTRNSITVLSCR